MNHHFEPLRYITLPSFRTQTDYVVEIKFSSDGRFLAIGYSNGVAIWDMHNQDRFPHTTTHDQKTSHFKSLQWFPNLPRLAVVHSGGRAYVLTFGGNEIESLGIRESGFREDGVGIAVLCEDLIAFAFTKTVQIRQYSYSPGVTTNEWPLIGTLRSPPAPKGCMVMDLAIDSIYALSARRILVSYGRMFIVYVDHIYHGFLKTKYLDREWDISSLKPFHANILRTKRVLGTVTDVSPRDDCYLVSNNAAGTYQIESLDSESSLRSFVPRHRVSGNAEHISVAQFIGRSLIIGGGMGQLVLWNSEARRLQNLVFEEHFLVEKYCWVYQAANDKLWIAAAITKTNQVLVWEWHGNSHDQSEKAQDAPMQSEGCRNSVELREGCIVQ
ncbi:hypothetical protein EV360DRAFT_74727 [Lentinula raphanica]|nr:hypothetical protein EV360DRAFT_74727 [Lentinula raphanica]